MCGADRRVRVVLHKDSQAETKQWRWLFTAVGALDILVPLRISSKLVVFADHEISSIFGSARNDHRRCKVF